MERYVAQDGQDPGISRSSDASPIPTVDFYFDFSSPFAYLASTRIEGIAARTGARLSWRPMLLGGVFKALGTPDVPLHSMPEARRRMYVLDMFRWAEHWGVGLEFPTRFPMNTVQALRCFLALAELDEASAVTFAHAAWRSLWIEDRDLSDPAVLRGLIEDAGGEGERILGLTRSDRLREALRQATSAAVAAGVFGAPTCLVNGKYLFWGQDRLELVEKTLAGWVPPC